MIGTLCARVYCLERESSIILLFARSLSFKMYGLFDISVYLDSHGVNKQDETSFGYKAFRSLFRQPLILPENKQVQN